MNRSLQLLRLVWSNPEADPTIEVSAGDLRIISRTPGCRLLEITGALCLPGPPATVISLRGDINCSFFLRDVKAARPLVAPEFGLAVTTGDDARSYRELLDAAIEPDSVESRPADSELTFEHAVEASEPMVAPTWLGLGGDARIFLVSQSEDHGCWGWVTPFRYHKNLIGKGDEKIEWDFTVGRGSQYRHEITRNLEEGCLPIIHSQQSEAPIEYELLMFATSDTGDMAENPPRGTEWRAAYMSTMGCMYSAEKQESLSDHLRSETTRRDDQPVFCLRVVARNTGKRPVYAWYRMPMYKPGTLPPMYPSFAPLNRSLELDSATGLCREDDKVFSINTLNGRALPNEEVAVLVEPGESAVFEALVPFVPIQLDRAEALRAMSFDDLHRDCRDHWRNRLSEYPYWRLPDESINQRLRAGAQHLMMNTLGERLDADSPLLATVGVYAPIGTESTPILWFLDDMGQHETVRRSLDYFFKIQRADGYIQSFNHYDAETGPVLALAWRHYLVTGDREWAARQSGNVARACRYLIRRRREEMKDQDEGSPGYGMISGKTADPDDYFHQFILNAQVVDGLRGAANLLEALGDESATEVAGEAVALQRATLTGFERALADAPLVPTENGEWVPMIGAWPGTRGEVSLYSDRGRWFTHGSFHMRALAFLHLVCFGVIEPFDPRIAALVRGLENTVLLDHTGPSQPYGRRLDYFYAATGRVTEFLELYFRQVARLQDRETFTFWEHYYKLSSQKVHEEAWFLQQTVWMICFVENDGLTFLKMAPKSWFEPGPQIQIERLYTVFGQVSLEVNATRGRIEIRIRRWEAPVRNPSRLGVRIPRELFGTADTGRYDPTTGILDLNPGLQEIQVTVSRPKGVNDQKSI
ncbi:MAG: hypothetical protein DRP71_13135 [Verrucomicrobia bacterium]|nr:MAG: hypothetical protein DRP71_13135 [Verrucomicrobiota bacterium]